MALRWSATLRSADDTGVVVADLASHLASCVFTTNLNAGFDTMTTQLKIPSSTNRIPNDHATEIMNTWRGMIGRIFVEGQLAWSGRISSLYAHDYDDSTCLIEMGWSGHVYDLEREKPSLDASYSDDFATVSASELVRVIVGQSKSLIAKTFVNVRETAVNIGPVSTSIQDSSLSLILNQLKGASADGVEYAFLIFDPSEGPYLVPIGNDPPKYRIRMSDSPGVGVRWSLSEYVSTAQGIFTNGDGVTDATDVATSLDGPLLNNNLISSRTISLDAVNLEGAVAARDAFLRLHENPIAISGSFSFTDFIPNSEGGTELAGLVRAGEVVRITEFALGDIRREWAIQSTSFNPMTGQLSVTLDQRAIKSRENERMTKLRIAQRLLQPGSSGVLMQAFDPVGTVAANATDVLLDQVSLPFNAAKHTELEIVAEAVLITTSLPGGNVYLGYTLDGEDFVFTDNNTTNAVSYAASGSAGENQPITLRRRLTVSPGEHRLDFYGRQTSGVSGTFFNISTRVAGG